MNNQNKHALLIGINRYNNLPSQYQLNGCINDIEMMAGILEKNFGFPEGNITMLKDEEATREGILAAFKTLTDRIADNDVAVIHYSGHGSRMRDREGDKPDGWDETIVPHDSGRGSYPNRDISDDEIYLWLLQLTEKTPYVTLIFDCCNSGTIARDVFGNKSRWVEPDERPVEELPPSPVFTGMMKGSSRDIGPSGWLPLSERYVLIAGCRNDESSYEHNIIQERGSVSHGALTYFLSRELTKAETGATYRDIFERASVQVTAHYPHQHPQMEGARDRELFGIYDIKPTRFVPVKQRAGDRIILGAGAAHGMTVRSKWAIHPQGTKHITKDTRRLGLVEITDVGAVTSDARISEEAENGIIEVNTRAVEEEHFYGEMCLKVEIKVPGIYQDISNKLAECIKKSALLSLVEAAADVRAYVIESRTDVGTGDPVPQLKVVDKPAWAVVGQDGKLIMPIHKINEAGVVSILCDNLEKVARYRQAIVLRNPDEESLLKGKVDFILKRQKADGTWAVAEPDNASGYIIFEEGEHISCEIINHHDSPVYVSILDFGLTGAVTLFYPISGANEQLEQGRSIQIGVRKGDTIELYIPEIFPYVLDPEETMPIGGIETFKLFATTHEADFSPLIQPGFRGITKGAGTRLMQLLDMALTGHGTRDSRRNRISPEEEWTTIEHSFFLQKKSSIDAKTRSVDKTSREPEVKARLDEPI